MRVRIARPVVIGLIGVLVLASCGGGDEENTLSEEQMVSQANEICSGTAQRIEQESATRFGNDQNVGSTQQFEDFATKIVVPEMDTMVDRLEELKVPVEEKVSFEDYLSETRKALDDDLKQDPVGSLSQVEAQDPFAKANRQARRLGLSECSTISNKIRSSADRSPK
ncbi:MAG: hypothetical protein M3396_06655 [Actinomycetota bacterium]|nr:hypothetical protein [Actinomycetota bacterium]MDQ3573535.1 hypothetical protein [Actinomycetota bacterium]